MNVAQTEVKSIALSTRDNPSAGAVQRPPRPLSRGPSAPYTRPTGL